MYNTTEKQMTLPIYVEEGRYIVSSDNGRMLVIYPSEIYKFGGVPGHPEYRKIYLRFQPDHEYIVDLKEISSALDSMSK